MFKTREAGTVFWITGLSGAGKTTFGTKLYQYLHEKNQNVVYLDGDVLRDVFGGNNAHTLSERLILAKRYSKLCEMLSAQHKDVVCATISMFHEVREWNRENIENYIEVYIKVPMEVLAQRDQKQLYSRASSKQINNVMGVDVIAEYPINPDLVINNDGSQDIETIFTKLVETLENKYEC